MLSQRRRHSRWRMYLICLAFLGLTCNSELASANVPESSSSAPTAKRKSQDIGSLSDFAWQAWLLVDSQNGFHGVDSATLLRRITPKSVFIAPALPACAEGYRADTMGRCVKSVNIDENAHISFLLERLNAMYANSQTSGNKNDKRKSTGPLQLNIPLIPSDPKPSSTKVELEETFSMNNPVVVPPHTETHPNDEEKTRPHEVVIASAYEMKNDTMLDEKEKLEEKTTFLAGNSSIDVSEIDRKADAVVPVADFVEETNDTNFSEVVDYKIPIDVKTSLNTSNVKRLNASDITKESVSITEKPKNFTEMSPTLIFLIPSTKLPSIADDLSVTQNETVSHVTVQMSNVTSNKTMKEVIAVSVPDSALPDKSAEVPSVVTDEQRDNETHVDDETSLESSKLNESQETEFVYDEEEEDAEYSYSTDIPDDEDSVELENEEILRHGEAGMTIPTRSVERLHSDQQQQNQTADQKKTLEVNDQIMIRFNDSMPTEDKDEAGSNVSSEVSINGDLILETTLLDVNTEKLQVTTKSPDAIIKSSDDGPKESFSKSPDTEPDLVIFQEVQDTTPTSLHGRKQIEGLIRFEDKKNKELERGAASSSSETLLYDFPEEHPITEIRMPDKEQSTVKESMLQENPKDFQLNVPVNDFKQTTMNLGSTEDYVRFPDYVKKQPQQDGYVRFPASNEANSIHGLGYKQHSHHPIDDVGPHDGTSTKSSVPVRQKPVYYLPSWKPERLQTDHVPGSEKQKQRPDLLRFWSKMPLIRDPDIYPVDRVPDDDVADDAQGLLSDRFLRASRTRKLSRFTPEISPENIIKVRAQKRRTSIGG